MLYNKSKKSSFKKTSLLALLTKTKNKNWKKGIGIILASVMLMTSIQPAYARILFKGEFLIEDNGTNTWVIDSGDDVTGDLSVQFGNTLGQTITYDTTDTWFEFSDDLAIGGTTMTLDADNTGTGSNVEIIANQGTDNDGVLRYNAVTNQWEISNDGGSYIVLGVEAGSGSLETFDVGSITSQSMNIYQNNATWGGMIIPTTDVEISALLAWVTQTATGDVQGAIYNANTNAQLATTATASSATNGIKELSFATPVELIQGTPYYLAVSSTGNGSLLAGRTATATFNNPPYPSFIQNNNRLPATLTPQFNTSLVWIGTLISGSVNSGVGGGGTGDFEDVYATDADKTLTTGSGDFTINSGTGDFIVNSNYWDVNNAGNISTEGTVDVQNTLQLDVTTSGGSSNWYNNNWNSRKQITINASQVSGTGSHTNFPVLINLTTDSDLAAATQTDADDILFTASDGTTKLDHEIESYNSGTGQLTAWVRIPSLSTSADTDIYMYYENGAASSQENVTGTWNTNYITVQHLEETSGTHLDSTSTGNNSTAISVTTQGSATGQINGADDFDDANTDYVQFGTSGMTTSSGTIDIWANMDASSGVRSYILTHRTGTDNNRIYLYEESGTFFVGFADVFVNNTGYTITPDTWHLYTLTWSGANWEVFVDGTSIDSGASATMTSIDASIFIGSYLGINEYFDGILDELKISDIVRSDDWISTEYNNQNSPATFYSLSTEENLSLGDAVGNIGTLTNSDLNLYTNNESKLSIDGSNTETIITLDGDNTSTGKNATIIANQGTDNDGAIRYNATLNQWEYSNDGGTFQPFGSGGGSSDFESVFATDADNTLTTSNATFTVDTGTGDYIITSNDWGIDASGNITTTGTVDGYDVSVIGAQAHDQNTDTGSTSAAFTLDSDNAGAGANIEIIAEQGTDNNGILRYNATLNQWEISNDGGTFEAIATGTAHTQNTDIGTTSNTFTLDTDDTGGDVVWQFGTTLAETFEWNNTDLQFELSDDLLIIDEDPSLMLSNGTATTGNRILVNLENTLPSDWYSASWTVRKPITINASQVDGTGSHTNIPILVNLTSDSELSAGAQADGDDILFTASDGITKLDHEIESYTSGTGALVAWVKVPTLSTSADTDIYMYYGNSGAANQQNATGVWSNGYLAVYHFAGDPSSSVPDSTGTYNATGVNIDNTNVVTGIAGNSYSFNGTDEGVTTGSSFLSNQSAYTIEGWLDSDSIDDRDALFGQNDTIEFAFNGTTSAWNWTANDTNIVTETFTDTTLGGWHYFVNVGYGNVVPYKSIIYDGNTTGKASAGVSVANYGSSADPVNIGYAVPDATGDYTTGDFDEVRFSSVARSDGWISTTYNNIDSPATFHTLGTEEAVSISNTVANVGTVDTTDLNLNTNDTARLTINGTNTETTITLDADNTSTGNTATIIANQGSDNDGGLRYNASTDQWEISNDGGTYVPIATGTGHTQNTDTGTDSNSFVLDNDDTGGNVLLQFGTTLSETITWNAANSRFEFSDDIYTADSILAGTNMELTDTFLRNLNDLILQSDNDTDDYIYLDTTANEEYIYFEDASLAYTNDPGFRLNSTTGELEYRDEDEGTWTSFDSLLNNDFEGIYATDGDNTLTTGNGDFTINSGTGDTIITSNDWGVDASGNITTTGTVDGYDVSVIGAQAHDQNTDTGSTSTAFTLDSDNAGAGVNVEIIANQGTDNDGIIRYNTATNQWEYSNDGTTFLSFTAGGGLDDFESVFVTDSDNTLTTSDTTFTINTGTADFIITSNDWGVDASGNLTISGTVDGYDVSVIGAQAHDQNTDVSTTSTAFTLDADNTGTGTNVEIIAEQGTENNGIIRYNATTNQWEYSNDGTTFQPFGGGGSDDFEAIYATDGDNTLTTGNGDFTVNSGTGDTIITSNDWGVDASGNITTTGTVDGYDVSVIGAQAHDQNTDTGTTSNTFILDTDDTGGNVTWQFGTTLAETFTWNNTNLQFDLSDDLFIDGNLGIGADPETNIDLYIQDTDPALMISNGTASTGNRLRFDFGSTSAGGWYSSSWSDRKPITINASQVNGTGSHTDFPILINLTSDTGLSANAQADGDDILFTSSDGMTKLDHEIEVYTTGTGALRAWVKIPSLSTSVNTVIYMYYGNSGATNQQNVNGVWSNSYAAVYHMDESGASETDGTSNGNNAVFGGTMPNVVTGKIGSAHNFNGSSDYAEAPDSASLDITSAITLSAWINPDTIGAYERIVAKSNTADVTPWTYYGLLFDGDVDLRMEITDGGAQFSHEGTTDITTGGGWFYTTATYDGSNLSLFHNGNANGSTAHTGSIDTNNMPLSIGRSGFAADYFDGQIDEVRVSSVARSATWISTEYNNQNSPATFYSVGTAEAETFNTVANIGTVDSSGLNLYTNNTSKLTIDGSGSGTTITLDADNTGTGNTATIIANQGSDTDGGLRYNATTNQWEISNNGNTYQAIATNPPSIYNYIDTTADATANNDTTDYWDEGAQNGNQHPNITPSSTGSEVLVMATISFDPGVVDDTSVVARIERNIGSDPVCGTGTQVGDEFGWLTSDNDIDGASVIYMDSPATTSSVFYTVCSDSDTTNAVGLIQQIQFTLYEVNNSADIAEVYATNDTSITSGDIVSFDTELSAGVKKSEKAYDSKVLGVVSTQPAKLIGGTNGEGIRGVPIALSGRVPIKVSTENGEIKAGDPLTASSIPGVAMKATKAGYIIGRAFGEYAEKGIGLILGFIGTHYADPEKTDN
jgi:hypothetical protein